MITNDDGWIYVKYLQTIPHQLRIRDNVYVFVVKRNVNLTLVRPEDVGAVMAIKKECCGGSKRPKYVYANERDVMIWGQ